MAARAAAAVAAELVAKKELRADTHRLRHDPERDARVCVADSGGRSEVDGLFHLRELGLGLPFGCGAARREHETKTKTS
jgi:hypothetical protein